MNYKILVVFQRENWFVYKKTWFKAHSGCVWIQNIFRVFAHSNEWLCRNDNYNSSLRNPAKMSLNINKSSDMNLTFWLSDNLGFLRVAVPESCSSACSHKVFYDIFMEKSPSTKTPWHSCHNQGVHSIYQLLLFLFHLFSLTLFLLLCFIVGLFQKLSNKNLQKMN